MADVDEREIDEKVAQGAVFARVIIEVLGKPSGHVEQALRFVLKKLKDEPNGFVVKSGRVFAPKQSGEDLFSAFAELEILFSNVNEMFGFCFEYMPSSIDVIKPLRFESINAAAVSSWVNDVIATLHMMDKALKQTNINNMRLEANATAMLKNLVKASLKSGSCTVKELSASCGISESQLGIFLEKFIKEGMLQKKDDLYSLC